MTTVAANIASTDKGKGLAGSGLVVIWNGIREDKREDFMEWHPRQHMVERLSIPGFLRGRRCIALDGATEFLTIYELTSPDVLLTDAYKRRLANPTDWSTATLPAFTDNTRGACRILFTEGYAMGGAMLTLRFAAREGQEPALVEAMSELMPRFTSLPRITGAHFAQNDTSLTGGNAGSQRGRVIMLPELIVMIEGSDARTVGATGEALASDDALQRMGAKADVTRGLYQLEYSIQNIA
jgi:hypothetical protein